MVNSNLKALEEKSELLIESALSIKLQLSFEERIESHENARQLISDLSNAPKDLSARPKEAS